LSLAETIRIGRQLAQRRTQATLSSREIYSDIGK
jgi:hypothetical protein